MDPGDGAVVGILAGGGSLPREIADAAVAAGHRVAVVGLEGEADAQDFAPLPVTLVNWGQIGRLVSTFRNAGASDLVIVGSVTRPDLTRLRTDLGFWRSLPSIARIVTTGGDDGVLRRVIRFFEHQGFRVVAPAEIAPGLVIGSGALGAHGLPDRLAADVSLGFATVARLAAFDIGQAVVVRAGNVIAIEAVEGTDAMLARIAGKGRGIGGVLVKRPKPGQELRIDMPAVGPATVARCVSAGLEGIVVEAGATLAAERAQLIAAADAAGVFVAGVSAPGGPSAPRYTSGRDEDFALAALQAVRDAAGGSGVVVVRRHVLAVESGEGLMALVQRAAGLRQWGGSMKRRRGVLAIASPDDATPDLIAATAAAGLSALVLPPGTPRMVQDLLMRHGRRHHVALVIPRKVA